MQMSLMNRSFTDHYYGDCSTRQRWEDRSGRWDWLGGLDKLAHYVAMLGGYIPHSPASSAILDVGWALDSAGCTVSLVRRETNFKNGSAP